MNLLIKNVDLSFLSAQYENIEFHMFCSDDHFSFISCIVCICESPEVVIESWRAIQNIVSVYHQPAGELAAWNVYLVFVTPSCVPVWNKYEIENNKFAARKIILDYLPEIPNIDQLAVELQKQLLGTDLALDQRADESREALLSLIDCVRGIPLDSKKESKEKRTLEINRIIEWLQKNEN
ncbi:ABC-three component system middle component 1 [Proteus mirabilis]|uniref:ABC-three component system middle component 1 n=1 Tax=Proteus mirabilis TaxID=584 RepID=UPI000CE0163E|nr:ABC-three component system middle component 1 [Proteus mirabilis]AVB30196.1 hypothetical protein C3940_08480 [Proteus mirabilis]MCU9570644.1 hypothetical protein [Proteus mirabilis]QES77407.1 hypothetical protein F3Y08_06200 [Proteus mirabilis]QTR58818.1 hypothetical protein J8N15_08535 [Proteus mirabilis]HAT5581329.1 hypothetical protein [Proteus mirabilis]